MNTHGKYVLLVIVALAVGLMLAPTVTAYAHRQQVAAQAAPVVSLQHGPRDRHAHADIEAATVAACLRRAAANDPSELLGTELCGPVVLPASAAQPQPVLAPGNGQSGARRVDAHKALGPDD
jgi:hypothetical protein